MGLTREVFDQEWAAKEAPVAVTRRLAPVDCVYEPYACTLPDDVHPMSPIGGPHLVRYTTSTHDQRAYLAKDPELIGRMLEHYERKITDHVDEIALFELNEDEGADTLILCYGVVARSAKEAVRMPAPRGEEGLAAGPEDAVPRA